MSHLEWFEADGWVTDDNAQEFMDATIRGIFVPARNALFFYTGMRFFFDAAVVTEASRWAEEIMSALALDQHVEVYVGPADAVIHGIQYRQHRLGTIESVTTLPGAPSASKGKTMSRNKQTVQKYMDAFRKSDHTEILSCLTDDVEWVLPGVFHLAGKEAFDKEIENDAFVGSPTITDSRMIEEHDVVVAEGTVRAARRDGGVLNAVFCDVFVLRDAKIKHLTSYVMEVTA